MYGMIACREGENQRYRSKDLLEIGPKAFLNKIKSIMTLCTGFL